MSLSLSQKTKQDKSKQGGISFEVKGKATGLAAGALLAVVSWFICWRSRCRWAFTGAHTWTTLLDANSYVLTPRTTDLSLTFLLTEEFWVKFSIKLPKLLKQFNVHLKVFCWKSWAKYFFQRDLWIRKKLEVTKSPWKAGSSHSIWYGDNWLALAIPPTSDIVIWNLSTSEVMQISLSSWKACVFGFYIIPFF